ncbi:hypothetical protein COV18_00255 [Candidatus Woesearchaeota archaeon CG10_big_fil_rev_8_21_14_0_10_37_12]|nr:MAG: hypothetical protein COV18_00255 [Candidatus Woesearchaeota archaeon CG10_big_fil_rev_8_21_14_0_10_37_12]
MDAYKKLRELGHEVSYDWTTHKNIKPYLDNAEQAHIYSTNELTGLSNCDVFIFFADNAGHTLFMEFGASLLRNFQQGKPHIFVIGEVDSSPWFFNNRVKRVDFFEDVLNELRL